MERKRRGPWREGRWLNEGKMGWKRRMRVGGFLLGRMTEFD